MAMLATAEQIQKIPGIDARVQNEIAKREAEIAVKAADPKTELRLRLELGLFLRIVNPPDSHELNEYLVEILRPAVYAHNWEAAEFEEIADKQSEAFLIEAISRRMAAAKCMSVLRDNESARKLWEKALLELGRLAEYYERLGLFGSVIGIREKAISCCVKIEDNRSAIEQLNEMIGDAEKDLEHSERHGGDTYMAAKKLRQARKVLDIYNRTGVIEIEHLVSNIFGLI